MMWRNFLLIPILGMLAVLPQVPQAPQTDISKWSAKDAHQDFVVAAETYSDQAGLKDKFGKVDLYKAGILGVDVYFRNNMKDLVHVDLTTIRLDIEGPDGQKYHLEPLTLGQASAEIAHPNGPSAPRARRFPVSIPLPAGNSKEQDIADKLRPFAMKSDVVPPGSTVHGCFFFDMNHHFDMARYASLYVPDVKSVASTAALIYFDVPLVPHHSQ